MSEDGGDAAVEEVKDAEIAALQPDPKLMDSISKKVSLGAS